MSVKMDGEECKAQNFADDTTLTIAIEEESLRNCIKYIEEFKKLSAANLENSLIQEIKFVMIWKSIGLTTSNS